MSFLSSIGKRVRGLTPLLVVAGLLGVALTAPAAAWANPSAQSMEDMEDMDHLKSLSGKEFEIAFMSMMIMHHQSAVDMAELVPDRAARQEVKDVARQIIADQTREIGEMRGWLRQWYNTEPQGDMMHGGMMHGGMTDMDMAKLRDLKGDEFDKEFLLMMRMHHLSAIEMAELAPDRATHSELKDLARNIIRTQQVEIEEFEGWLMAWYNVDAKSMEGSMPGEHGGMTPGMPRTGAGMVELGMLALALASLGGIAFAGGLWLRKRA